MNKSTQSIEKAFTFTNADCRIYVPFSGNLTKAKKIRINNSVIRYSEHHGLSNIRPGWISTNIEITRTEGRDLASYTEDGAGGADNIWVCHIDFAECNKEQ